MDATLSQVPLSSLQLLPLSSKARRRHSPCPLLKIQCKDIEDRVWVIQRCPYSVEQLSSLLPGRQVISYANLLSLSQASQPSRLSLVLDGSSATSFSPRTGFRSSVAARSKSLIGGGASVLHKRSSLSDSITSMSGIVGGSAASEVLDEYTDKVDALLRKITRQRRDDDPAVRDWFDDSWGVPVETACAPDGCRLRQSRGLQKVDGMAQPAQGAALQPRQDQSRRPSISPSKKDQHEADFSLDLGRFSPFDAGSQFHSPASSRSGFELAQRRSQEVPAPLVLSLGSFAETTPSPLATPRIPSSVESQTTTPRPDRLSPSETLYDSEGLIEAEIKWILSNFPLPPKLEPVDDYEPTLTASKLPVRRQRPPQQQQQQQQRAMTPPQSPTSIEIRLQQASATPSSTYSARSSASRETASTTATTVLSYSSRNRVSSSTCGSNLTDFSDVHDAPSKSSSRGSQGPLTPRSVNNVGDHFLAVVDGDSTPRDESYVSEWRQGGAHVSPRTLPKPLPGPAADWRLEAPPPPPPLMPLPPLPGHSPPSAPPAALPPAAAAIEKRPFAALLEGHSPLADHVQLPTGPRQFSSMSVLPSPTSNDSLASVGRSPSPRKGSLLPSSSCFESGADGHRFHRPHQGMLNPYLRKSPSDSLRTLPSVRSASSSESDPSAMPRSATSATLATGSDSPVHIFKVLIPSAERTVSVSVGIDDSLLDLRDKIATKLRRTNLELPDKWSLATAQLSSTREKIVGEKELASLLAGKLKNGDPTQPCLLRVIEA